MCALITELDQSAILLWCQLWLYGGSVEHFVHVHPCGHTVSHRLTVHSGSLSIRPYARLSPSSYLSFVIWVTFRWTSTQLTLKDTSLLTNSQLHRVHYLIQFKSHSRCSKLISPRFNIDHSFDFILLWNNSSWIEDNVVTASMLSHIQWWIFSFSAAADGLSIIRSVVTVLRCFHSLPGGDCGERFLTRLTMFSVYLCPNCIQPTSTCNDNKYVFKPGEAPAN